MYWDPVGYKTGKNTTNEKFWILIEFWILMVEQLKTTLKTWFSDKGLLYNCFVKVFMLLKS